MSPHPLTRFEIHKYYHNEPKFNGAYSGDNLPNKIKDWAYIGNLDEYFDIGTYCVAFYVKINDITYLDSFGVEHIPKEIIKFIGCPSSSASLSKNVIANSFRTQAYDPIMCGHFFIGLFNFMLSGKKLTEFTNLSSHNNFKRKHGI